MKESSVVAAQNASVQAHTWCCLTYTGADGSVIPQDWIIETNGAICLPNTWRDDSRRYLTEPGQLQKKSCPKEDYR